MILIPALLLYFFNKYDLDKSALDFDKVFSFLLSYSIIYIRRDQCYDDHPFYIFILLQLPEDR